ncbi:hypothetical protein BU24DRAFT_405826 [Aaosphaeria arxii CBS 175.79]|uniref:Uncharacterized protein n=1 Tax=Aaosphaeria arxii CBS 175.79 TaxID=1450172 RepID=A0A6A5Y3H9_9PLEO|nr:uncharacterized protein BU24DRAFT_405826 [Aaosphaeria arxii CBS 175.79]KAF2019114.1 hypothetical protein BU24DRAFT_405826 [Aaosphaeria arxii CBS 175.79]
MAPISLIFSRDEKPKENSWSTAAIVSLSIFTFITVSTIVTITAYYLHRRAQHKKLPPEMRPVSYHPFRTQSSDKAALLQNGAPSPEEDKTSMFSRDRGSSLSLYVDTQHQDRRASMETINLIPLHVTPAEEARDPLSQNDSNGSGVSGSSRSSRRTSDTLGVSTISVPEGAASVGGRPTRPRSTSSTSQRYYEVTTTNPSPQVPKIVHTPSE